MLEHRLINCLKSIANFYHKQGAVLSKIDEYAYYREKECREEVQLIWYLYI